MEEIPQCLPLPALLSWFGTRLQNDRRRFSGPRKNVGARDWQNMFAITRFCYIKALIHILHCYWDKEYRSLYRRLRYIEKFVTSRFHCCSKDDQRKCRVSCHGNSYALFAVNPGLGLTGLRTTQHRVLKITK